MHQDVQYFRLWKKPEETQRDKEHPNCGWNTNPDTFHYCRGAVKSSNPVVLLTVAPFLCTTDGSRRLDTLHYSENPPCLGTWKRNCRSALTFGLWLFMCVGRGRGRGELYVGMCVCILPATMSVCNNIWLQLGSCLKDGYNSDLGAFNATFFWSTSLSLFHFIAWFDFFDYSFMLVPHFLQSSLKRLIQTADQIKWVKLYQSSVSQEEQKRGSDPHTCKRGQTQRGPVRPSCRFFFWLYSVLWRLPLPTRSSCFKDRDPAGVFVCSAWSRDSNSHLHRKCRSLAQNAGIFFLSAMAMPDGTFVPIKDFCANSNSGTSRRKLFLFH